MLSSALFFAGLTLVSWTARPFRIDGPDITLSDSILLLSLLLSVFARQPAEYRRETRQPARLIWVGNFIYFSGLLATSFGAADGVGTVYDAFKITFTCGILVWLGQRQIRTKEALAFAIGALCLGAAVNGIAGGYESHLGKPLFQSTLKFWGRSAGFTEHPNELGSISATCAILSFNQLISRTSTRNTFFALTFFAAIFGLLSSASMSSFAAFIIGAGVSIGLRKNILTRLYAILAVLLAAPFAIAAFFNYSTGFNSLGFRLAALAGSQGNYVTAMQRKESYYLAFQHIAENPLLGVGHSTFWLVPHNFLLYSWWHGGLLSLVGELCILAGLVYAAVIGLRARKMSSQEGPAETLLLSITLCVATFLIMSMFAPGGFRRSGWAPMWLLLPAVQIALSVPPKGSSAMPTPSKTRRKR